MLIDGEHCLNDIPSMAASLQRLAGYGPQAVAAGADWRLTLIAGIRLSARKPFWCRWLTPPSRRPTWCARCAIRHMASAASVPAVPVRRAGRHPDHVKKANDQVCLLVQAEPKTAIDNLMPFSRWKAFDGVLWPVLDLSASFGYIGNAAHPDVQR